MLRGDETVGLDCIAWIVTSACIVPLFSLHTGWGLGMAVSSLFPPQTLYIRHDQECVLLGYLYFPSVDCVGPFLEK